MKIKIINKNISEELLVQINNIDNNTFKFIPEDYMAPSTLKKLSLKFPKSINVILDNNKFIGFSLFLPCNKKLMHLFLEQKITEEKLVSEILKKINLKNFSTIYLCSSYIDKEYRGKGIATDTFIKSLKYYKKINKDTILFAWDVSDLGLHQDIKISKKLKLRLITLIDFKI